MTLWLLNKIFFYYFSSIIFQRRQTPHYCQIHQQNREESASVLDQQERTEKEKREDKGWPLQDYRYVRDSRLHGYEQEAYS